MRLAYASRDDGGTLQETFLACASTYDDTPQLAIELVTHTPIASVSETVSIVTTPTIMLRLKSMQVYTFEVIYPDF